MFEANWQKSSFSSSDPNTNCVEIGAASAGTLLLREGEEPAAVLAPEPHAIRALLTRIKAGNLSIR